MESRSGQGGRIVQFSRVCILKDGIMHEYRSDECPAAATTSPAGSERRRSSIRSTRACSPSDLDWRITAFNQAAERITGVPAEQAIGSPCCDVFRASICETSCALRRTMASGKPVAQRHGPHRQPGRPARARSASRRPCCATRPGRWSAASRRSRTSARSSSSRRSSKADTRSRTSSAEAPRCGAVRHPAADRRQQLDRADRRAQRHGQGAVRPGDPQPLAAQATSRSWRSTAPPCRTRCWRASCSATRPGRSPTPSATSPGGSRWPTAARSSWTRSATSRRRCRSGCCGCSRSGRSSRWAASSPCRWTCG